MALSAKQIQHAPEGMHADGHGLYLRVQAGGAKSWIFRYQLAGRRREMGLGPLANRGAVEARAMAGALQLQLRSGIDPIAAREAEAARQANKRAAAAHAAKSAAATFDRVAAEYIAAHRSGWSNAKHAAQWAATLATYASPTIGNKPVADVAVDDVLTILQPIWAERTETASRVRGRIELVLNYAKALKLRSGENPAVWRGHLDALLPKRSKVATVRHQPALPYKRVPAFMKALRKVDGMGARALEFAILTAARSGEVRLMTPAELDLEGRVWVVPAGRMKMRREHRVPLSDAAIALLQDVPAVEGNPYVFAGARDGAPISDMTLTAVIRRLNEGHTPAPWVDATNGAEVVPHGFRSSFRDWCSEATSYPNELAEMALAHTVGDKVEAAYRRGDMIERRQKLMQAWASFVAPPGR